MEIHRHELKYSLVLIDAAAEHGGITHVRGKCDCGYGTTTITDRNRKSSSDSELRRFIQQLTLRSGHTCWTKLQTPCKGLGITEDARDNGIEAFVMVLQVVRCPSHRIRSDVVWRRGAPAGTNMRSRPNQRIVDAQSDDPRRRAAERTHSLWKGRLIAPVARDRARSGLKSLPWSEAFLDPGGCTFLGRPMRLEKVSRGLPRKYRDQGDKAWIRFR